MASGKHRRSKKSPITVPEPDLYEYMRTYSESGYSLKPEDKTVCLKYVPTNQEISVIYNTPLANLVSSQELPVIIEVQQSYSILEHGNLNGISLKNGDIMMLHFIVRPKRVFATDQKGIEVVLPIYAKQLYEVLPIDPIHDDKVFNGTAEVIRAKPLPKRIRVINAFSSSIPEESQEVGDVIDVSHIEKRSDRERTKVLVGRCSNSRSAVAFSEKMNAVYTTMVSEDVHTLSEIVNKFPLPVRIRKADDKSGVFYLNECKEEANIICTHINRKQMLALPLTINVLVTDVRDERVDTVMRGFMPQIYTHVNWSWGVREIGRAQLPSALEEIPVPISEVLAHWLQSKEGKTLVESITEGSSKSKNAKIAELIEEIKNLKKAITSSSPQEISLPPRSIKPVVHPPVPQRRNTIGKRNEGAPVISLRPITEVKKLQQELSEKQKKIDNLMSENKELNMKLEETGHVINKLETNIEYQQTRIKELETKKETDNSATYEAVIPRYVIPESFTLNTQNGSINDVATFLESIGLSSYVDGFRKERVDVPLLLDLDADIMQTDLKMSKLHVKRLLLEIARNCNNSN